MRDIETHNEIRTLLRADEVASKLSVSPGTVYRWAHQGEIDSVRVGSGRGATIRFPASALERIVDQDRGCRGAGAREAGGRVRNASGGALPPRDRSAR